METTIKIDILNEKEIISKYDEDDINQDLIKYILSKAKIIKRNKKIKVLIKNKSNLDIELINKIKSGLVKEYDNLSRIHYDNNRMQFILFLIGFLVLLVASFVNDKSIWNEVLIIIGWVPIWKAVNLELINDFKYRQNKRVIKRVLKSKFEIK